MNSKNIIQHSALTGLLILLAACSFAQDAGSLVHSGSKVYIDPMDVRSNEIARDQLDQWGYWKVTQNRGDADFILRFHIERTTNICIGYVEYVDPRTEEVFKTTRECNTKWSVGSARNFKQLLVKKLIRKRIVRELSS